VPRCREDTGVQIVARGQEKAKESTTQGPLGRWWGQPCPCETRLAGPGGAGAIATGAGGLAGGTRDCRARRATAVKFSIPGAGRPGQRQESASSRAEGVLHAYWQWTLRTAPGRPSRRWGATAAPSRRPPFLPANPSAPRAGPAATRRALARNLWDQGPRTGTMATMLLGTGCCARSYARERGSMSGKASWGTCSVCCTRPTGFAGRAR
jgi:hypothetical protein